MTKERELLRRVYKMLVVFSQGDMLGHDESKALTDIEAYFLTPCDDPETDFGMINDAEEPVAWMFETARGRHYAKTKKDSVHQARLYGNYLSKPLYLHPPRPEPARKPMTEREIMEQAKVDEFNAIDTAVFAIGVRWAERMHGIGGDDA